MSDLSLQDGMLEYYQQQAKASDVNVEKRIDSEPFDFLSELKAACQTFQASSITELYLSTEKEPSSESAKSDI
jgi:hypothetical protein